MALFKQGISPENFYGAKNARQDKIEAILKQSNDYQNSQLPKFMLQLLGPSKTWKVFKKQQDAIDCCFHRRNGLMPFAFEDINGKRMFLVAHPKVFWALNSHRFFKNCSTYEIIRECSACKLYFDIEFEYEYNKTKVGDVMLNTLLDIINLNLKNTFNIFCTSVDILDLDSSSDTKFSRHVIYEIKNTAFQDNYACGNFVKQIASELRQAFESNSSGDSSKLHDIADKYNLQPNNILELFICDRKGQTKLLIDEGVYTKNRHFRLLGSSKKAKNIPLKISNDNNYIPQKESGPLEYFLDSLVTYFSWNVDRVLEFGESKASHYRKKLGKLDKLDVEKDESPAHKQIDSFVENLVSPNGRVRRKVFFSGSSTIVYDIQGFRFCENIKREHKSNNIKYVVDLENLTFYQKCYDPDCADFRSDIKRLPDEICFSFEDKSLFATDFDEFLDEELLKAMEQEKCENSFEDSISEEDLEKVAVCAEAMLGFDW